MFFKKEIYLLIYNIKMEIKFTLNIKTIIFIGYLLWAGHLIYVLPCNPCNRTCNLTLSLLSNGWIYEGSNWLSNWPKFIQLYHDNSRIQISEFLPLETEFFSYDFYQLGPSVATRKKSDWKWFKQWRRLIDSQKLKVLRQRRCLICFRSSISSKVWILWPQFPWCYKFPIWIQNDFSSSSILMAHQGHKERGDGLQPSNVLRFLGPYGTMWTISLKPNARG